MEGRIIRCHDDILKACFITVIEDVLQVGLYAAEAMRYMHDPFFLWRVVFHGNFKTAGQ